MKGNSLTAVPECLKSLDLLEDIALDDNAGITEVPGWLTSLKSLKNISLSGTAVKRLPDDLSGWRSLRTLNLAGCPMSADERRRIREALPDVVMVF